MFAHSHQSITTPTRRSSSQPRTSKPKPPAADIHHVPTVSFRAGPPQHVLPSRIPAPCTPRPRSGQPQIKQDRSTVRDQTSLARWQHLRIVAISIIRPQTRSALYRLSIKGIGRYRRGVPGAHRDAHWSGSGASYQLNYWLNYWECKSATKTNYSQQDTSASLKVSRLVLERRQG